MTKRRFSGAIVLLGVVFAALSHETRAQLQGQRGGQLPQIPRIQQPCSTGCCFHGPASAGYRSCAVNGIRERPENRPLPSLSHDNFQILEDGVEQKISYFWEDNRPISVGLLIDDSDWMTANHKLEDLRDVLPTFLKGKNPVDEYFVLQFATSPV